MRFILLFVCLFVGYHQTVSKTLQSKLHRTIGGFKLGQYQYFEESVRRNSASSRCNNWGQHLATFKSLDDINELKEILSNEFYDKVWIGGLYDFKSTECSNDAFGPNCWYWDESVNSSPFYDPQLLSFSDEARNHKPQVSSAMVLVKNRRSFILDHAFESEIHAYICQERQVATPTPPPTQTPTTPCHCPPYTCRC